MPKPTVSLIAMLVVANHGHSALGRGCASWVAAKAVA
jgi:hypothetical protein